MNTNFVSFDDIQPRIADVLRAMEAMPAAIDRLYLVRDLYGRVRISVSDAVEDDGSCQDMLKQFARNLYRELGPHGYDEEEAVSFVDEEMLEDLSAVARPLDLFVSSRQTGHAMSWVYWGRTSGNRPWLVVIDSTSRSRSAAFHTLLGQRRRRAQYHCGGAGMAFGA